MSILQLNYKRRLFVWVLLGTQLTHALPRQYNTSSQFSTENSTTLISPSTTEGLPALITTMPPQSEALTDFVAAYQQSKGVILRSRDKTALCNADNVEIRKEWGTISRANRKAYIQAVHCLARHGPVARQASFSKFTAGVNRYEEFVAAHLLKTDDIHFNGVFFAWHRHFTWLYNQELRNLCGYEGPIPYWDWTLNTRDPQKSPVFDGSEYPIGSNGEYHEHGISDLSLINAHLIVDAGTGGGCVTQGPFANWTVHIGNPVNVTNITDLEDYPGAPVDYPYTPGILVDTPAPIYNITSALEYHEDCLKRDLNPAWSNLATADALVYLLTCDDLLCFQTRADGFEISASEAWRAFNKLHTAGHLSIGGLNNDVYASAGDPIFYLHHAMVDRTWALWQGQDMEHRLSQLGASRHPFNNPPSPQVTMDEVIDFAGLSDPISLREVASTVDGPYCYIYE